MNILEIFQALKADAYSLLFDDLDQNFRNKYFIKETTSHLGGLQITFDGPSLGLTFDTATTLYRDSNNYATRLTGSERFGYAIPHHERRTFLYDLAREIMALLPEWYFNPDSFDISELPCAHQFDLDRINSSESRAEHLSAVSENLSQINAGINFFTQLFHNCPLAHLSPSPSSINTFKDEPQDCEYLVRETDEFGEALSWKCVNHDLLLQIVGKNNWRPGKFAYSKPEFADDRIDQALIDNLNDKYHIYLSTLSHLQAQLPSFFDIDEIKPLKVLTQIDQQLKEDSSFFDFLKPSIEARKAKRQVEEAKIMAEKFNSARVLKPEVADQVLARVDELLKKHVHLLGLGPEPLSKTTSLEQKVCSCSSQTIFSQGCQCSKG